MLIISWYIENDIINYSHWWSRYIAARMIQWLLTLEVPGDFSRFRWPLELSRLITWLLGINNSNDTAQKTCSCCWLNAGTMTGLLLMHLKHRHWTRCFKPLSVRGPSYLGITRSMTWLLVPWLLTSAGHQQPSYWQCRICRSWIYLGKDFKYLCHINME